MQALASLSRPRICQQQCLFWPPSLLLVMDPLEPRHLMEKKGVVRVHALERTNPSTTLLFIIIIIIITVSRNQLIQTNTLLLPEQLTTFFTLSIQGESVCCFLAHDKEHHHWIRRQYEEIKIQETASTVNWNCTGSKSSVLANSGAAYVSLEDPPLSFLRIFSF